MANDLSIIQSLKAVDAWIDVINANINGGVRTAFKASRLRFAGSNTMLDRAPTTTSLPLQLPEPGLITANTVIDFSQGAITASTENTHLALQGDSFFLVVTPDAIDMTAGANFGRTVWSPATKFYLTRDGEFRTNAQGLLVNSAGLILVTHHFVMVGGTPVLQYANNAAILGANSGIRAVFNDLDNPTSPTLGGYATLSTYVTGRASLHDSASTYLGLVNVPRGKQSLQYSRYGSTIWDFGYQANGGAAPLATDVSPNVTLSWLTIDGVQATISTKSLEASNASMTQSVPELSLAQKLFSALTKVLQIGQTNTDSVLNLVR